MACIKITDICVDIIGYGLNVNPDKGGVEPLAVIRMLTEELVNANFGRSVGSSRPLFAHHALCGVCTRRGL